jgi:putative hydrolase of the HAD superfamily
MRVTTVGLDADDTFWHNETLFRLTQDRFAELLSPFAPPEALRARLAAIEARNLRLYGYGVKGFTLSMIETAMEVAEGADVTAAVREILAAGREMLAHPVEPLPGVTHALTHLAERYRLVLVTKGDLLHQERKLAASGLGELFTAVEIVSEKDAEVYARVFARHGTGAAEAAMVGNSLRSDVLPALEAGAFAAHIPYAMTWAHELADAPLGHPRFAELASISELPGWLEGCATEEQP